MPDTQNPDQFAPDCGATVDQLYQSAVAHVRAERRVSTAMVQHTRGPWVAHDDLSITTVAGNAVVATVYGPGNACVSPEQAAADARLIAAAPDLLEALKDLLAVLRPDRTLLPLTFDRAETAIAKAVHP